VFARTATSFPLPYDNTTKTRRNPATLYVSGVASVNKNVNYERVGEN